MSENNEQEIKIFSEVLIKLEKDLTSPGSTVNEATRIDRILRLFSENETIK